MSLIRIIIVGYFTLVFASCRDGEYNRNSILNPDRPEVNVLQDVDEINNNVGRAIWQKPGLVIQKLGDISEKVIADIGAGTGYFSFKLALHAKKVIAIEIDQHYLNEIDSTKMLLPVGKQNIIETRLAEPNNPKLSDDEVDIVLIINTVAYIHDLQEYLSKLRKGMKKDGRLMIIDYKMKKLAIDAPPKSERIYLDKVEDIVEQAGYKILESDDTSLDFQYILIAINQ